MTNLEKFYKLAFNILDFQSIEKYTTYKDGILFEVQIDFDNSRLIFQNFRPKFIILGKYIASEENLDNLDLIIDQINHSSIRDEMLYGIDHSDIKILMDEGYVETNRMRG